MICWINAVHNPVNYGAMSSTTNEYRGLDFPGIHSSNPIVLMQMCPGYMQSAFVNADQRLNQLQANSEKDDVSFEKM